MKLKITALIGLSAFLSGCMSPSVDKLQNISSPEDAYMKRRSLEDISKMEGDRLARMMAWVKFSSNDLQNHHLP